jgi:GT2 family glycosyltransferase
MEAKKITIGMPTAGECKIETVLALIMEVADLEEYDISLSFVKGTYLHDLRNKIVAEARENKSEYLMFIDSDVTFIPGSIRKLIEHDKDLVGAPYNMKMYPLTTTIKPLEFVENFSMPKKLFKCAVIPTGFMLLKLDSFKNMPRLFDFDYTDEGDIVGEDVWFCNEARKLGIDVWCDPAIEIGHIGAHTY